MRSWWRRVSERRSAGDGGAPDGGARHPAGAGDWRRGRQFPVGRAGDRPAGTRDRHAGDGSAAGRGGAEPAVAQLGGTRDPRAGAGRLRRARARWLPPEPAPGSSAEPAPNPDLPRIGFVGAGRVGTALGVALRRAGWPVTAVASRDPGRRDRFVGLVPGAHGFAEGPAVLDEVDVVFVTVPDDAIAGVASQLRLYSGQAIVHTSGVLPASVLAPAMAAGTEAGSFHPLVAFADLDAALAALPGATVAIEGDEPLMPLLGDLAGALGARAVRRDGGRQAAPPCGGRAGGRWARRAPGRDRAAGGAAPASARRRPCARTVGWPARGWTMPRVSASARR